MKSRLTSCLAAFYLFLGGTAAAQSYIGHTTGNYSGIHGVLVNPASVVDSRFRTDINLFSVSTFAGSDYFALDLDAAFESEDGFNFRETIKRSPKDNNQFFLNVDILGPSVMFNLDPKSSIALSSRLRVFANYNNINGMLYESLEDGFQEEEDYDFAMQDFSGTIHAWSELGLTYGRILVNNESNLLKGGITLKYLQGGGSNFIHAPSVRGMYNAETEIIATTGSLSYGNTRGFDSDDVDFSNLNSGFGGDIGLMYEFRPDRDANFIAAERRYRLKLGISVTDIGSISYDESTVTAHNLEGEVDSGRFDDEDLGAVLEEEYPGTDRVIQARISLPTALHAMADYSFNKVFYLNLQASMSLVSADAEQANRIINSVVATPRLESKWFSFYLPVSLRQYDGLAMGAGLRLGPLSVGSGSVISNYVSDSSKTTDVFVGLKIPVYRKTVSSQKAALDY